jgi:hypothetical protein
VREREKYIERERGKTDRKREREFSNRPQRQDEEDRKREKGDLYIFKTTTETERN